MDSSNLLFKKIKLIGYTCKKCGDIHYTPHLYSGICLSEFNKDFRVINPEKN